MLGFFMTALMRSQQKRALKKLVAAIKDTDGTVMEEVVLEHAPLAPQ